MGCSVVVGIGVGYIIWGRVKDKKFCERVDNEYVKFIG